MNAPNQTALASPTDVDRSPLNARAGSSSTSRTRFQPVGTGLAYVRYSFERTARLDMMLVAGVRAALAIASVFIIWFVPQERPRFVVVTYTSLIAYAIYSACVVWALARSRASLPHRALAWLDVAIAGYLVSLTAGTNSIFFFFFFFAIIWAAFTRGFREGMQITVASTFLFVVVGLVMLPFPASEEFERMLIRPVYLLALGFLISHWGGGELELKRRLTLLNEIGRARNSREGADATIDATLRRLCAFFGADSAVLALEQGAARTSGTLYTASAADARARHASMPASRETIRMFMAIPERGTTWPRRTPERYVPIDTPSRIMQIRGSEKMASTLANLLDAKCITSAGYRQGDGVEGRLVLARERKRFADGDAAFLAQCAQTLAAAVESITLTEELVARAAEVERLSISRDLHDTTIQPYIGLRMAIEGLAREFRDSPRVAGRLAHLVEMTDLGIEELRDYTTRLKSGSRGGASFLGTAIERQSRRLSRFYGLDVDVQLDTSLELESGAADAIFQMVSEGLSNVLRHTAAKRARVAIRGEENCCVVEIANPLPDGLPSPRPFVPRSIAERAADLGGRMAVKAARDGHTIITVSIPRRFQAP